jgi:hypothetical protein
MVAAIQRLLKLWFLMRLLWMMADTALTAAHIPSTWKPAGARI